MSFGNILAVYQRCIKIVNALEVNKVQNTFLFSLLLIRTSESTIFQIKKIVTLYSKTLKLPFYTRLYQIIVGPFLTVALTT